MRYVYLKENNAVREAQRVAGTEDPLAAGGTDIFISHFIKLAGTDPKLVLSLHSYPEHDEQYRADNLTVMSYLWHSRWLSWLGSTAQKPLFTLIRRLSVSSAIFLRILLFRPDRVLCWTTSLPLWACYAAARLSGARFVCSRHGRFPLSDEPWFRRLTGYVDKRLTRRSDAVVVHGPYLRDEAIKIGVDSGKVIEFDCIYPIGSVWNPAIGNGPSDALPDVDSTVREILFLGRLERSKGVFELLEACAPLMHKYNGVNLIFAGDGDAKDELKSRIEKFGLTERVLLLGMIPHHQLAARVKASSFVVTPTRRSYPEGRCMTAMEALVMGRPVIAPHCGPFPYLVQDNGNGLLYEPDSIPSLRACIENLLLDRVLYNELQNGARRTALRLIANQASYYCALCQAFNPTKGCDNDE